MNVTDKIARYIKRTKFSDNVNMNRYGMGIRDFFELARMDKRSDAVLYAFNYGVAKGYRAAKAESHESHAWES